MLTRRHLRIKALHALFAYAQSRSNDLNLALYGLEKNIDRIHDLYLHELKLFWRFTQFLDKRLEAEKVKQQPSPQRITRVSALLNSPFLQSIAADDELIAQWEQKHVHWGDHFDVLLKIFHDFWVDPAMEVWFSDETELVDKDSVTFIKRFYRDYIANNEVLHDVYEDMHMDWADDLDAAQMMTVKSLENAKKGKTILVDLYKNQADKTFVSNLLMKTIQLEPEWKTLIEKKATSWKYNRLTPVDRCLIELALTELVMAEDVPVKVTINEAIELAKQYGSENSPGFINGLLDALAKDLQSQGKILKTGRGLIT